MIHLCPLCGRDLAMAPATSFDLILGAVRDGAVIVRLTPAEAALFGLFYKHLEQPLTQARLVGWWVDSHLAIRGEAVNVIRQHIMNLRRRLEPTRFAIVNESHGVYRLIWRGA